MVDLKIRSSSDDYAPALKYTINSKVRSSVKRMPGGASMILQRSPYIKSFVRAPASKRASYHTEYALQVNTGILPPVYDY